MQPTLFNEQQGSLWRKCVCRFPDPFLVIHEVRRRLGAIELVSKNMWRAGYPTHCSSLDVSGLFCDASYSGVTDQNTPFILCHLLQTACLAPASSLHLRSSAEEAMEPAPSPVFSKAVSTFPAFKNKALDGMNQKRGHQLTVFGHNSMLRNILALGNLVLTRIDIFVNY